MHHAAKLYDMGRKPEVIKDMVDAAPAAAPIATKIYPYGCCLCLDDEMIKTLQLDGDMPPVGAEVHGCFTAVVKAVRAATERIDDAGNKTKDGAHVEIEIHELGFAAEDDADREIEQTEQRRKTWYGGAEPDGDEG